MFIEAEKLYKNPFGLLIKSKAQISIQHKKLYYTDFLSSIEMRKCSQVLIIVSWVLVCTITIILASLTIIQLNNIAILQQRIAKLEKTPENSIKCKEDCEDYIKEFGEMCCNEYFNQCKRKIACKEDTVSLLDDKLNSINQLFQYYAASSLISFGFILLLACFFCKILKRDEATGLMSLNQMRQRNSRVLRQIKFKNGTDLREPLLNQKQETCSICLQNFEEKKIAQLRCHHVFHWICIQRWMELKDNCPTCRRSHF